MWQDILKRLNHLDTFCLIKGLCETGTINPQKQNQSETCTGKAAEFAVLGAVAVNPELST
jgi:hypothetical protein